MNLQQSENEQSSDSENDVGGKRQRDPDYNSVKLQNEKLKAVNKYRVEIDKPPLKKLCSEENSAETNDNWIADLRQALSNEATRSGKITLLTTVPLSWSVQKMRREFQASSRMASRGKKFHISCGYGARPQSKVGPKKEDHILEKVQKFYILDENCRIMPGRKDYISVLKNGERLQLEKNYFYTILKTFTLNLWQISRKFKYHYRILDDCGPVSVYWQDNRERIMFVYARFMKI